MQLEGSQMYVDYTDPQHMRAYGEADTDAMHIHSTHIFYRSRKLSQHLRNYDSIKNRLDLFCKMYALQPSLSLACALISADIL